MEGPKDIRKHRFLVNEDMDFWSGKCRELSIFHISVPFYWYVPSNFPDSNPMNLFAYGIYTTSRLGFGVPIDWRALEGLKLSQKRLVSLSLSISLSLSLCLSLRVRKFQNRPLGEASNRKKSGPSARQATLRNYNGNAKNTDRRRNALVCVTVRFVQRK